MKKTAINRILKILLFALCALLGAWLGIRAGLDMAEKGK